MTFKEGDILPAHFSLSGAYFFECVFLLDCRFSGLHVHSTCAETVIFRYANHLLDFAVLIASYLPATYQANFRVVVKTVHKPSTAI